MKHIPLFLSIMIFYACTSDDQSSGPSLAIVDIPGHPYVFEVNRGDVVRIERGKGDQKRFLTFKVKDYTLYFENNLWFPDTLPQLNIYRADVYVEINEKPDTLVRRGYQFPEVINGFRWYVEAIAEWDTATQVDPLTDLKKEVRMSVCLAEESWGPEGLIYPIRNYRWRASSYMNTWSALVPYNLLYYHHGEDMGAIPDILDVESLTQGRIISSPYPDGDGRSNGLFVAGQDGFGFRLAHMNIESILPTSARDLEVNAGQILGKTGETWNGYKSQHNDPHLHVELNYENISPGSYPYLMEAYFRDYPDKVLAVTGGCRFGLIGDNILLDASRSLTAEGEKISRYLWITHNGDTLEGASHVVVYNAQGLYSEQLIVETESGYMDRDFLQVRIYRPASEGRGIVHGFAHYSPVQNIRAGDPVLFWNRLVNNETPVRIDFGDGSPAGIIEDEILHHFDAPGNYVVTLSTTGKNGEPATVQLEVIVEG